MSKIYTATKGLCCWEALHKKGHWKDDFSAKALAESWEAKPDGFPESVQYVFLNAAPPLFEHTELLFAFPEYKVRLPGGNRASQNDIFVIAKAEGGLISIMVEGKAEESFDRTIAEWLGTDTSDGKKDRLGFLLVQLNLHVNQVMDIKYQLLHRTVSAMLEAKKVNAPHALMLVHSFSKNYKGYNHYAEFVSLFGLTAGKERIVGPVALNGTEVYFGWVTG